MRVSVRSHSQRFTILGPVTMQDNISLLWRYEDQLVLPFIGSCKLIGYMWSLKMAGRTSSRDDHMIVLSVAL